MYAGFICHYGAVPATLVPVKRGEGTKRTVLFASVMLLTPKQLRILDKTEIPPNNPAPATKKKKKHKSASPAKKTEIPQCKSLCSS